ncbi:hypothetical protein [Calothrix sp. CCY 0018]|uniref:hypothetical protein n=1 Tax=Calothrix sp. CCY 0018 TaxID=3103864 RepID=UPI0039C60706
MSDSLSIVISFLTALPIGIAMALSGKKNSYWSTADFLPLVLWILLGALIGLPIQELLKNVFGVDNEIFLRLVPVVGSIITGCGIYWYRTRTVK